jgi:hypothetical protein
MRKYMFITLGTIFEELSAELAEIAKKERREHRMMSMNTFHLWSKKKYLPQGKRTVSGWRHYTRKEADQFKKVFKKSLGF